jgi:hypothetical protein
LTVSTILPNTAKWEFQPKLYQLEPQWRSKIWDNGKLALNNENRAISFYYFWEKKRLMNSSDVILLNIDENKLKRLTNIIIEGGKKVDFKSHELSQKNEFKTRLLFEYLVIKKL